MTMRKKLLITIVCLSVVLCTLVTGTLAWLIAKSDTIENTFTPSKVSVKLEETGAVKDENGIWGKDFQMVPGKDIAKDPKVTVSADSEDCYVFVKIAKSDNVDDYLTYNVNTVLTKLVVASTTEYDVYYCLVNAQNTNVTKGAAFSVLVGDKVTVNGSVTMEMMNELYNDSTKRPTLKFTAYAIQQLGFDTPEAAWAEASK